jgi:L-lactate dehydrogenase complex protein LldG
VPLPLLLERFCAEAEAVGVTCFVEPTADAVGDRVAALVSGARVLSWDPEQLPYGVGGLAIDRVLASAPRPEQAAATAGLTACDAAIADTGSLVVLSRPGRSRAASLLPPFHVAIVRPDQLYGSMAAFFSARQVDVMAGGSCTFITGPSRTADIELTLTLGIHGPARVAIVIGP